MISLAEKALEAVKKAEENAQKELLRAKESGELLLERPKKTPRNNWKKPG